MTVATDVPHPIDVVEATPLAMRIAFSGHRSIDPSLLRPALAEAFALAGVACAGAASHPVREGSSETIIGAHASVLGSSNPHPDLILLAGFAPGADQAAVRLWRERGHGRAHVVFPYADPIAPAAHAWTDRPNGQDMSLRVDLAAAPFEICTVLDGEAGDAEIPPRSAHLEQVRWLVRWADVVIVAWNGESAAGVGGTADTVALAIRKGLPVVWLDTSADGFPIRLLSLPSAWAGTEFSELVTALAEPRRRQAIAPPATAPAIAERLIEALAPPHVEALAPPHAASSEHHGNDESETWGRERYGEGDPFAPSPWTGWRRGASYLLGRVTHWLSLTLGRGWARFYRARGQATPPTPDEEAAAHQAAATAPAANPLIEKFFKEADDLATRVGDVHRAVQAMFLIIAILAVVAGTTPAALPVAKPYVVGIELGLLVLGLLSWRLSYVASSHRRWSDLRRFAERLRVLRATWPLGIDVSDDQAGASHLWTEWQGRVVRRAAGPPTGSISAAHLRAAALWACLDPMGIVAGQAAYNDSRNKRMEAMHRFLRRTERLAFFGLLLVLFVFLPWHVLFSHGHAHGTGNELDFHSLVGGIVLMLSAIIPTIAAACLAFEAKLDIAENIHRAARLRPEFSEIARELRRSGSIAVSQERLRQAARLLLTDVDAWSEAAARRVIATF